MAKRDTYILWIDDESDRESASKTLEETIKVAVQFEDVSNKNIPDQLTMIRGKYDEPALIMIDHWLTKATSPHVVEFGSSVAEILREEWPECPIVAITNAPNDIDDHKKSSYEEVIPYMNISQNYSLLHSIISGFKLLKRRRPKGDNAIIRLLIPPKDDIELLKSIMPRSIRDNYDDKSLFMNIYRWIKHTLMSRPGFLYDRLWVATLLGIKEESLAKVYKRFEQSRYTGIFMNPEDERWWQSEVKKILFASLPEEKVILPWKIGPCLPELSARDKSKCYRDDCRNTDPPDVVAFVDETSSHREQMHRRCTTLHPKYEKMIYFEELRMMDSK